MLIKKTKDMTDSEQIAVDNSNNQYLRALTYAPVGMIIPFGGGTIPSVFLVCDGSALDTTEYADLFNAIGYTYGGYDDSFYIPDLSGATVNGVNVKYIIKTTNGITEDERLKILANVDQTYNAESENAQSGKAVAEAIDNTAVLKTETTYSNEAGKIPIFSQANTIRSGTPKNSMDCANKKYVDDAVANAGGGGSVDLSEYVKKTDLATETTAGLVVVKPYYGISLTSAGALQGVEFNANEYTSKAGNTIISKGTLENVLAEKIGDIDSALTELHNYAQALIGGNS